MLQLPGWLSYNFVITNDEVNMLHKILKKILLALLILLVFIAPVSIISARNLSEIQKQMEENEKKKSEVEGEISHLEDKKTGLESYLGELNKEISELNSSISSLETKMTKKEAEILVSQEKLKEAEAISKNQYEAMKLRIRFMYEMKNESYFESLIKAEDISDILNKISYVKNIVEYDRNMLEKYNEVKNEIAETEKKLLNEKEELHSLKTQADNKRASVNTVLADSKVEIENYKDMIADAEAKALAYEEEIRALQIKNMKLTAEDPNIQTEIIENTYIPRDNDLKLLATIIYCEAGNQSFEGKLAVGSVVLNRVNSKRFSQNNIYDVIFAPGQFAPVTSGRFAMHYALGVPESCYQAAQEALNDNIIGGWLFFLTKSSTSRQGDIIGDHVFFYNW